MADGNDGAHGGMGGGGVDGLDFSGGLAGVNENASVGAFAHSFEHVASVGSASNCASLTGWTFGSTGQALAHMGILDPALAADYSKGPDVRLPGIVVKGNVVQVLVWPHGHTDTQQLFRCIAARHGFVSLSRRARGIVATRREHETLLDTKQFDGPGQNSRASGSYPGATGVTTVWNEYWQLPSKKHWWQTPDIHVGPPLRSHLVVTGYTWFFGETGDFETRVAIAVTNPQTTIAGQWVPFNEESVRRQFALSLRIAEDMHEALRRIAPKEYSRTMRQIQARAYRQESSRLLVEDCVPVCGSGPGLGRLPRAVHGSTDPINNFEMQGR